MLDDVSEKVLMLEKPDIADATLLACLRDFYGVDNAQLEFLPLGADRNTAVYRAASAEATYFVKLRGGFDEMTVIVPKLLHDAGVDHVIAPIPNALGHLWTPVEDFHLILYPFVAGTNGFERELTAQNWIDFGRALKSIHSTSLPPAAMQRIPKETFSSDVRRKVSLYQTVAATTPYRDPIAAEFAAFMTGKKAEISALVHHADRLGALLRARTLDFIPCHADIHVGNLLITPSDHLYVVDWDTLLLAPKERDLMFAGMGLGSSAAYSADQQTALFYQGYGPVDIDPIALAYYRCERIVQDVFEYTEQILFTEGDSADRWEGLRQFRSQFEPNAVVERAFQSIAALPPDAGSHTP